MDTPAGAFTWACKHMRVGDVRQWLSYDMPANRGRHHTCTLIHTHPGQCLSEKRGGCSWRLQHALQRCCCLLPPCMAESGSHLCARPHACITVGAQFIAHPRAHPRQHRPRVEGVPHPNCLAAVALARRPAPGPCTAWLFRTAQGPASSLKHVAHTAHLCGRLVTNAARAAEEQAATTRCFPKSIGQHQHKLTAAHPAGEPREEPASRGVQTRHKRETGKHIPSTGRQLPCVVWQLYDRGCSHSATMKTAAVGVE
jgi:hypothetical protein